MGKVSKPALPNPTATVVARVETLVCKYKSITKKTDEAILEQAKTVFQAEEDLAAKFKKQFYERIGLDENGSTVRKLKLVGREWTRFQPLIGRLPNTWTTLYALAKLDIEDFKRLDTEGVITPLMGASEIRNTLKGPPPARKTQRCYIDFGETDQERKLAEEIVQLADRYQLSVGKSKVIEEILNRAGVPAAADKGV